MSCDICKILENKDAFHVIYEDEKCFSILHEMPATVAHALVIPKKHATIIEELDDVLVSHVFNVANLISTALFEVQGAQGTNILLNNGADAGQDLPHVVVHVLPRKEEDGINMEWPMQKAEDTALKTTQALIKRQSSDVYSGKTTGVPKAKVSKPKQQKNDHGKNDHVSHHDTVSSHTQEHHDDHADDHGHESSEKEEEDYLTRSLRRMP